MRTRPKATPGNTASDTTATRLTLEVLESRDVPSIAIQISYAYDTSGFFTRNPTAAATLQLAANDLAAQINTSLAAIAPSGTNTWTESFYNPATGQITTVNDPSIAANTIVIYAGARALGSSQASQGAFGGYGISGTQAWIDTLQSRSPGWGSLLWGGSIVFDTSTNWYFGSSASGLTSNQEDFFTCATHEIAHVLGIGTSPVWFTHVSNDAFTGSHAEAVYGGPVPLAWNNGELDDVTVKGTPPVMNLDLPMGVRTAPFTALDWALLEDVGWAVAIPSPPAASPPTVPPPATATVSPPTTVSPPASATPPLLVSGYNGLVYEYAAGANGALTSLGQIDPFTGFTGTVRSTVGDFTTAGVMDYAFVTGSGTAATVRIINATTGANIVGPTPILGGFTRGAFVAAGDLSGNGTDDLVVSEDAGGQPLVQVYQVSGSQLKLVTSFMAFGTGMVGGVRLAMGDLTGNGIDNLVIGAGPGVKPWVEIYNGAALAKGQAVLMSPAFLAFPATSTVGVNVAVGDLTGDGYADLIVSQDAGGSSLVEVWSGATIAANPTTTVSSLTPYVEFEANGTLTTGIRTTVRNVNGVAELITAPASGPLDWVRTLTVTSTSVTADATIYPFGTDASLDGVFLG